jgi:hypothetical protein
MMYLARVHACRKSLIDVAVASDITTELVTVYWTRPAIGAGINSTIALTAMPPASHAWARKFMLTIEAFVVIAILRTMLMSVVIFMLVSIEHGWSLLRVGRVDGIDWSED